MKKVAVTGGISCGKSLASRYLKECGAYVVDADDIVHQLLSPQTDLGQKIIALLGPEIVVNGKMERKRIGEKVFNKPELLRELEALLHPGVYKEIETKCREAEREGYKIFVAEIPLLFETGGEILFDKVIAIVSDLSLAKKRFIQETASSEEAFERRTQRQMSSEEKARHADFVVHNDGEAAALKEQMQRIYNGL